MVSWFHAKKLPTFNIGHTLNACIMNRHDAHSSHLAAARNRCINNTKEVCLCLSHIWLGVQLQTPVVACIIISEHGYSLASCPAAKASRECTQMSVIKPIHCMVACLRSNIRRGPHAA